RPVARTPPQSPPRYRPPARPYGIQCPLQSWFDPRPLGHRHGRTPAHKLRPSHSDSLSPCGEGGWGSCRKASSSPYLPLPTPDPSPQGGGKAPPNTAARVIPRRISSPPSAAWRAISSPSVSRVTALTTSRPPVRSTDVAVSSVL